MTRKVVGVVVWAVLFALPGVAQEAGTAAPASTSTIGAVDANSVVDVDLEAGLFKDPLPFDVPFYVRGDSDAMTASISAKVLQFPEPVNCLDQEALFTATPGAGGEVRKLGPREKHKVVLRDLGRATETVQDNKPKFLLLVPALPVNRSYCFRIDRRRKLSSAEEQQFRAEAFAAVDEGLRDAPPDETQLLPAYERLRQDLIARVTALLGQGQELEVPPGSFFDADTPIDQIRRPVHDQFTQILAAGDARTAALSTFRNRQADAGRKLTALVGSDAYQKVAQALAAAAPNQPAIANLLATERGALDLADLLSTDVDAVVLGIAPGNPLPNLDQVFAPADLDAQLARLGDTVTGLRNFRDVVNQLTRNQTLRAAAGLDDAEGQAALAALPQLVDAARLSLDAARNSLRNLQDVLANRAALIEQVVADLRVETEEILPLVGSTLAGYELRSSWYVSADVGLGVAGEINEVFPYMGANVYFQPVNKKAHLGPLFGPQKDFWKRFAMVVGLPQNEMQEPGELLPVIQDRPLVVGAGLRLNDLLRVTVGGLVFEKEDPDPLVTRSDGLTATWFVSFSIDWDVRSSFAPVFKNLGIGSSGGSND